MKNKRSKAKKLPQKGQPSAGKDEVLYCICRSPLCDTFMIACDACEEWFHGTCINISQKQAEFINEYFCQQCRDFDPSLQVTYKDENPKQHIKPDRTNSPIAGSKRRAAEAFSNKPYSRSGDYIGDDYVLNTEASPSSKAASQPRSRYVSSPVRYHDHEEEDAINLMPYKRAKYSTPRGCNNCSGCLRTSDCATCHNCRMQNPRSRSKLQCLRRECQHGFNVMNNERLSVSPLRPQKSRMPPSEGSPRGPRQRGLPTDSVDHFDYVNSYQQMPCYAMNRRPSPVLQAINPSERSRLLSPPGLQQPARRYAPRPPSSWRSGGCMRGPLLDPHELASLDVCDSDDDVCLPDSQGCLGPGCKKRVFNHDFCSIGCQERAEKTSMPRPLPRRPATIDDHCTVPYALPYDDHMYCKHHRYVPVTQFCTKEGVSPGVHVAKSALEQIAASAQQLFMNTEEEATPLTEPTLRMMYDELSQQTNTMADMAPDPRVSPLRNFSTPKPSQRLYSPISMAQRAGVDELSESLGGVNHSGSGSSSGLIQDAAADLLESYRPPVSQQQPPPPQAKSSDYFVMANSSDNIELNWPTSPSGPGAQGQAAIASSAVPNGL